MRNSSVPLLGTVAATLFTASIAFGGVNDNRLSFVPWRVLEVTDAAPHSLLTLYWIPASPDELKRSALVTSPVLLGYAARCVSMHIIRVDDSARIKQFGATDQLPAALLIDGGGAIVSRITTTEGGGELHADEVENMVREAIDTREVECTQMLDSAKSMQPQEAAGVYRKVIEQRCAFPRLAKEAQRALKKIEMKR